ncbi:MAG: DUF4278 domain-containing protein [Moorea sp. SIO3I7]|uniref:DUF4278 domain-containing protein n=1 Tax=unclassified Moorena TaxID=2683338 RepID=UPI0013BC034F|nr:MULTISPECIES: DUF4278 domain-containing protein [unclassified Moorena]NEN99328.1 DUF4278 domain-containing protein [Moorena sp. SIO3I7]NEO62848.1 DUF4278 domain-containing protein [Moorena sp. SIO4G2]NEQ84448.1 DUF4278 domain-containing protein [Moorena sp. SIO2I5]NEO13756.1 DUF4278 domain-containing protein [Moorena sp. SIO3E8]NEP27561.1 DUF4278 domain-containing protein [Moorena sp. SIO3I6]
MKLTYRGVSYEYHPKKITTTEVNCTGKYRGLNCGLGSGYVLLAGQDKVNLKYRGISYGIADSGYDSGADSGYDSGSGRPPIWEGTKLLKSPVVNQQSVG